MVSDHDGHTVSRTDGAFRSASIVRVLEQLEYVASAVFSLNQILGGASFIQGLEKVNLVTARDCVPDEAELIPKYAFSCIHARVPDLRNARVPTLSW
jgi:hypothetical protein